MRIAIYHNLPSGGGKRALHEMTRRLADQHRVDVYTLSCAEHDFCDLRLFSQQHNVFPFEPLSLAHSPFGRVNQIIRTRDLYRRRAVERAVARKMDEGGYDVAFVHNCQFGQSPAVLNFLRTPSVYYCAEPPRYLYEPDVPRPYAQPSRAQQALNAIDPLPALYRAALSRLDRVYTRSASLVLTNSAYSRETLYRVYGIFARIGYLGVDTQRFRPLALPKENFVLTVGAMLPNKGFEFLLRSLALVDPTQRPHLVIVSNSTESQEQSYLEQLAVELDVTVEFRAMIPDAELVKLYNQALLTLYAPIMEPFGFVPLESMACGTPVVGVREAGVRESVTDSVTGLLTERDPREFAGAVTNLLNDPKQREQYGRAGRACVQEHWQWEHCVDDIAKQLAGVAHTPADGGQTTT